MWGVLFAFLLFGFATTNAQWVSIPTPTEIKYIRGIQIVDNTQIFIIGRNSMDNFHYNYLAKTKDLGENWSTTQLPAYVYDIRSLDFTDSLNGYAVAKHMDNTDRSIIVKTTNGGEEWRLCFTTPDSFSVALREVKYVNDTVCIALGNESHSDESLLVLSEDGGWNWEIIEYPVSNLRNLTFVNDTTLYISGGYSKSKFGYAFLSKDFGKTYYEISTPDLNGNFQNILSFLESDNDKIFIGGQRATEDVHTPVLYRSEDACITWERISIPSNISALYNMEKDFFSNSYYFSCLPGDVYSTDIDISNWESTDFPSTPIVFDLRISDSIKIARSSFNNIFTCNSTVVNRIDEDTVEDETFFLSQNYPNPFNPTTNISYIIPKLGIVKLKVFDLLGRKISTLVNKYQNQGHYKIEFDEKSLASGTYFYQLNFNGRILTKKFLLIR